MSDVPTLVFSLVGAFAALAGVLIATLAVYDRRRTARYDDLHQRAELEMMRRSTESKLYELNERLLATEARWRDSNHLLLESQSYQQKKIDPQDVQLNGFLRNAGLTVDDLEIDPKTVFVLTPFHPEFRQTFEVVRKVCSDLGLRAVRGDEDYVQTDILSHILRLLVRAKIVIAVIDGRNPNVFYELGIAHALNKPTILVSADTDVELPFDIQNRQILLAPDSTALAERLPSEITRLLLNL